MKIRKHPLEPNRIRRPPSDGWAWIDRQFLRLYGSRLRHDTIVLYVFLISVGDKNSVSYYGDSTIAGKLGVPEDIVVRARDELLVNDLIAFEHPLYQVLSLPHRSPLRSRSEPTSIVDIMREVLEKGGDDRRRDDQGGRRSL